MRLMTAFWKLKRKRGTTMSDPCKLSVIRTCSTWCPTDFSGRCLPISRAHRLADSWDDLISGARREANDECLPTRLTRSPTAG